VPKRHLPSVLNVAEVQWFEVF